MDIFTSCKHGNLEKVKYFVEKKEVDLNVTDSWDGTPLYYACLCGYFDIVQYLLENGATCEIGTRDGERCVYSSLTDEIRRFLLNSSVITSQSKRRDEFLDFCEKLWKSTNTTDTNIVFEDCVIQVHKSILCARSEYFTNKFQNEWELCQTIDAGSLMDSSVFEAIMQYIYTARATCSKEIDDICAVCDEFGFSTLKYELELAYRKALLYEECKSGTKVKISTIVAESEKLISELQADFALLINLGFPSQYNLWMPSSVMPLMNTPTPHFDLCLCADSERFYCHQLFLCTRSTYFDCLMKDHFNEMSVDKFNMKVIKMLDISADVLAIILYFVYTNTAEFISQNTVYDVLFQADIYLLPGLKRLCGNFLSKTITVDNAVSILKLSRFYQLPKLEDNCTNFMAKEIDAFVDNNEFMELILSDANEVKDRQETDSIPVIDDIRHHINICVQTNKQQIEREEKLAVIDQILNKLQLDA